MKIVNLIKENGAWKEVNDFIYEQYLSIIKEDNKMSIKEKVFQNHVYVTMRNGNEGIIVGRKVIDVINGDKIADFNEYDEYLKDCSPFSCDGYDIVKAVLNDEVIYDRYYVDWTKVEKDTKVLVKDCNETDWMRRYFAKYEDGVVYTYMGYGTSWSVSGDNLIGWQQAKLWEE